MKRLDAEEHVIDPDIADWRGDEWDQAEIVGVVEPLRREARPLKWAVYTVLSLLLVAVLIAGVVGWWYLGEVNPDGEPQEATTFIIRDDDTLETVSERLVERGFIDDAGVFRWYVRNNGGLELTPGYYEIAKRDHAGNILGRLRTPPSQTYTRVTFPEGFTLSDISKRLAQDAPTMTRGGFIRAAEAPDIVANLRPPGVTSLEGLVFPDTYQVSNGESEAQVIERMVALMERVGGQEDILTKSAALGITPYEALTVASMIEEEAKFPEDRPRIARVIYNRLARSTPLQIDATLFYRRDRSRRSRAAHDRHPVQHLSAHGAAPDTDQQPRSSVHLGSAQPGGEPAQGDPICLDLRNRSRLTGVPPPPCVYLYYVLADNDGRHAFAATFEQHQTNIDAAIAAGVEL
ncbi:MAG: endolytic transglycosylase MltG [Ilumatobacteraceae bacterium]